MILAACSGSASFSLGAANFVEPAIDLIEGELSDSIGLGMMVGACEEPASTEVDDTFECTGTLDDGRVVEFIATVSEGEMVNVLTSNIMNTDVGEQWFFAALVEQNPDLVLTQSDVECGDGFIIIADSGVQCTVSPLDAEPATATLTFTDLVNGEFSWVFE